MRISIAIDGPAGAGKSTIAKKIANKLGIMYINTGLMYRAITFKALEKNIAPADVEGLIKLIDNIEMYFENNNIFINGEDLTSKLTTQEINKSVASYAAIPEVRERLVELQRNLSNKFDVIMDGRDIGTVVLKNAAFKFYLTASPEERANRRYRELTAKGIEASYEEILKDIIDRDYKDMHREVNPLRKAEDAIEIDSTSLSIDEVVDLISKQVQLGLNSL
ncbi:Cytidylate kinase [Clostridium sp. N3C]|uniref:(d)CMP kinase n=1 Tax=Clostridium sp. N3C TaxID=1776758 RepID=UPI00092DF387|nr:(d)CMP kinase [Clostridium sp. N3C]SCN22381.1 Cytidylate kinase [Clostridium sp. N3C]